MASQKKKVGIFSFTCDEGCSIYLTEIFNTKLMEWLEKMELKHFLSIKDKNEEGEFDIALVEGSITTEKDKKRIEEVRKKSEILIGMGNCAITGMPSCQRNNFNEEKTEQIQDDLEKFNFLPKCLSVKEAVGLDDEVPGCPMNKDKFIETLEKYL